MRTAALKRGFTLAEVSIALIVIGMVIVIVFPALEALRKGEQRALAHSNLTALMRASAAFVQANGCLPCPTPAGTGGPGFGHVRGDTATAACGDCGIAEGIPPFVSLGLPAATAKDGWGHWITMRVDPSLAANFGIVPPTAPCVQGDAQPCTLGASQKGLCRATFLNADKISVLTPSGATQHAALLFLSHGPNGFGAFQASAMSDLGSNAHPAYGGPRETCSATSGFELCNADGDDFFVDAAATNDPANPFDDILTFMDRNALVASLGQGACQTAW